MTEQSQPVAATALATEPALLQVKRLSVEVTSEGHDLRIVDDVSFSIRPGEKVALVGESGSGKSVLAQAIMRLNRSMRLSGRISLGDIDIVKLSERGVNRLRGRRLGMVFQDPMTTLDPLKTIGDQVAETLVIHGVGRAEARDRARRMLGELGVQDADKRFNQYPHEFSGGMRQRVVLAMALIGEPDLLIADEPTTALDVQVQQQVLDLIDDVASARDIAVMLITHDLGIVAGFADRVMVMYSGRIVEDSPVETLFSAPQHPYTQGLLAAVPRIDRTVEHLSAIAGAPPNPGARPPGCGFNPRCSFAGELCRQVVPPQDAVGGHLVACHYAAGRLKET